MQNQSLSIKSFKVLKEFSGNPQNRIFLVKCPESGRLFVYKIIRIINLCPQLREVKIHTLLRHPFIINLLSYKISCTAIDLLIEHAPFGDLFKLVTTNKSLEESRLLEIFYKIVIAVDFLHSKGFVHRDIKPENVLLSSEDWPKLADFGFSVSDQCIRNTMSGTLEYMAPEVYLRMKQSPKVDVWSLGILLYSMTQNKLPFKMKTILNNPEILDQRLLKFKDATSENIKKIIYRLLKLAPGKRPTVGEILLFPEFKILYYKYKVFIEYKIHANKIPETSEDVLEKQEQIDRNEEEINLTPEKKVLKITLEKQKSVKKQVKSIKSTNQNSESSPKKSERKQKKNDSIFFNNSKIRLNGKLFDIELDKQNEIKRSKTTQKKTKKVRYSRTSKREKTFLHRRHQKRRPMLKLLNSNKKISSNALSPKFENINKLNQKLYQKQQSAKSRMNKRNGVLTIPTTPTKKSVELAMTTKFKKLKCTCRECTRKRRNLENALAKNLWTEGSFTTVKYLDINDFDDYQKSKNPVNSKQKQLPESKKSSNQGLKMTIKNPKKPKKKHEFFSETNKELYKQYYSTENLERENKRNLHSSEIFQNSSAADSIARNHRIEKKNKSKKKTKRQGIISKIRSIYKNYSNKQFKTNFLNRRNFPVRDFNKFDSKIQKSLRNRKNKFVKNEYEFPVLTIVPLKSGSKLKVKKINRYY